MTMNQNMNQFSQGAIKGSVAKLPASNVISCQLKIGGTELYAGSAVKLVTGDANTILIDKAAATDQIFGFAVFSPKLAKFTAGQSLEVALAGTVMYMESSEAFNRGQNVEYVASGDKVAAYAGVNTSVGIALDTASGAGVLVRVMIRNTIEYSSSSSSSSCRSSSSSSSSSSA